IHFPCSTTSYLMIYAKKRKLKSFHLNCISANFCCFIIGDLSPLLPEPVTYIAKQKPDAWGMYRHCSQLQQPLARVGDDHIYSGSSLNVHWTDCHSWGRSKAPIGDKLISEPRFRHD